MLGEELIQIAVALALVWLVLWVIPQIPVEAELPRIAKAAIIVFMLVWSFYFVTGLAGAADPPRLCP
jgi:ABC-type branched-subunit amino acid transport system permease subunit